MFRHPELDSGSHPIFQAFLFENKFPNQTRNEDDFVKQSEAKLYREPNFNFNLNSKKL